MVSHNFRLIVRSSRFAIMMVLLDPAICALWAGPPQHETAARRLEQRSKSEAEQEFLVENAAAMSIMMNAMSPRPTGDVDRDFVAMMIAHHQGAIDMAVAVLRHGSNAKIRRIANEIIVTQT